MEGNKVVIDEKALNSIRDIALKLFIERPEYNHYQVMFESLEEYLHRQGIEPCFVVAPNQVRR